MLTSDGLIVETWTPLMVECWIRGLIDDTSWLDNNANVDIRGKELLLMGAQDFANLGAQTVYLQEKILEAIEKLRFYNSNLIEETLQKSILRLSCLAKSLQKQLEHDRTPLETAESNVSNQNQNGRSTSVGQNSRVSLDSLASVSSIVSSVIRITELLNKPPFNKLREYRPTKSLLLAQGIKLTSTAQRDQFVDKPNEYLRKCCEVLADYCDKNAHGVTDPLLIQPFQLKTITTSQVQSESEDDIGFTIRAASMDDNVHIIDSIPDSKLTNKANKLIEGDEIVQINGQNIIGWSTTNVEKLLRTSKRMGPIVLTVKRVPADQ